MATTAANANPYAPDIDEGRRMPAVLTNLSGLLMVGGAVALLVLAFFAKAAANGGDASALSRFWHSYLTNSLYATGFSAGGLFFVIAHHLTGGRWGTSLRRLAEIVAGTMILSAALFAPILLNVLSGSDDLYAWNQEAIYNVDHADHSSADPVLKAKAIYLHPTWFSVRAVVYWVIWIAIAGHFISKSVKQDSTGELKPLRGLSRMSGPAVVAFALALNFAAFDWMMSLEPKWFSTMFGVYFFAGSFVGFLALLLLMASLLQQGGVLTKSVTTDNRHDVAKLMYAMIVFWGYITFSQFLLIWYANVPEETEWFYHRQSETPTVFGMPSQLAVLFILHLFVPFFGFMSRTIRRSRAIMLFWAVYMMAVHWLDLVFVVMPSAKGSEGVSPFGMIGVYEIAGLLAVLALMTGGILWQADGKWLLPVRDPRLKQATTYHNH